jgi:hypothetical protein
MGLEALCSLSDFKANEGLRADARNGDTDLVKRATASDGHWP